MSKDCRPSAKGDTAVPIVAPNGDSTGLLSGFVIKAEHDRKFPKRVTGGVVVEVKRDEETGKQGVIAVWRPLLPSPPPHRQ
ncbi:hypothetical protein J6590_007811 [Homalodisca vitripennis]|nr:hypothetical protein J6590_007811 [Homalodisca vitripennis]